ncbi:hypothetical protein ASPCAL00338 [Aspergillus calidoustus]|uniref:AA1-like domain-containing protein n=1 Tax=Aspergillus calidoustus TaxID=454130 RepID=A0A0U5FNJ4_ASPCI|nr:hypothetical protein ASPCAL00338 [Aspergillus calidoustus]
MHFSSPFSAFLTLLSATTIATASPFSLPKTAVRLAADPTNPALTWHVSNFDIGCSPSGCVYSFNIAGAASANTPGFNTTCNGTSVQDDYAACKDKAMLAQIEPAQYPNWTVKAQHQWRETEWSHYYAFGERNVTEATRSFTITVGEVYGVA